MKTYESYATLKKPAWSPPARVFGPVWTVLYILIAISFGTVFIKTLGGEIPLLVALPFVLNLIFNFAFTPIQFGLKNNYLAAADVLAVLGTLVWALCALYVFSLTRHIETGAPSLTWIIIVNIPYLLWVSFATVLQLTITFLNR